MQKTQSLARLEGGALDSSQENVGFGIERIGRDRLPQKAFNPNLWIANAFKAFVFDLAQDGKGLHHESIGFQFFLKQSVLAFAFHFFQVIFKKRGVGSQNGG